MPPVSGEAVFLDTEVHGLATRFVAALGLLVDQVPTESFALIGGFAVMVRLGRLHRITEDLDAAAQQVGDGPSRLFIVVHGDDAHEIKPVEGIKVDCIEVGEATAAALPEADLPDDEWDRAFVLAHRWALDVATPAELSVIGPDHHLRGTVRCRVAQPASLVAMKLQSAPRRPRTRAHKAGNDYGDLFFLLAKDDHVVELADQLAAAPHHLGSWCARRIREDFVVKAQQTAAAIRRGTIVTPISADDLQLIGEATLRRLGARRVPGVD